MELLTIKHQDFEMIVDVQNSVTFGIRQRIMWEKKTYTPLILGRKE